MLQSSRTPKRGAGGRGGVQSVQRVLGACFRGAPPAGPLRGVLGGRGGVECSGGFWGRVTEVRHLQDPSYRRVSHFLAATPQDVLALASFNCGAYTRALMHYERFIASEFPPGGGGGSGGGGAERDERYSRHVDYLQVSTPFRADHRASHPVPRRTPDLKTPVL